MTNNKKNNYSDLLYKRHLAKTRERIVKEQHLYFETLKDELINKPFKGQTLEEKQLNKKRLLDYVHRYVFLKNLHPVESNVSKINYIFNEKSKVKFFLRYLILIRDIFSNFISLRTVFILSSAFLFFFVEFFLHYYFNFSLKDINVTFQDIITKIPPFF